MKLTRSQLRKLILEGIKDIRQKDAAKLELPEYMIAAFQPYAVAAGLGITGVPPIESGTHYINKRHRKEDDIAHVKIDPDKIEPNPEEEHEFPEDSDVYTFKPEKKKAPLAITEISRGELRRLIESFLDGNLPGKGKSYSDQPKKYRVTKENPPAIYNKDYIPKFNLNELLKDQALKWSMQFDKGDPSMAALGHEAWVVQVQHGISILGDVLFEYGDMTGMIPGLPSVEIIYENAVRATWDLLTMGHFYNNPDASWIEFIADSEDLKKELADMGIFTDEYVNLMDDD